MVKTKRLDWLLEILTTQMNHWIFFPLVMMVLGIAMQIMNYSTEGKPGILLWAACGLLPILCFLVRYYAEKFWFFVLCHGAVLAAAWLAAILIRGSGAITCVICAVAYVIYSFALRLRDKENAVIYSDSIHPVTALALSVGANFLFHRQENMPDWDRYFMFTLIGVFACYLIIYYLKHYLNFLQVNKSSAGYLPAREILHSGIGFVLPYTLAGVLILFLSLNVEWLEPVLHVLKEGLKILLRAVISLLPSGDDVGEPIPIEEVVPSNHSGLGDLPVGESFWLWQILEYLALILFFCGCAYALIKALKWIARYIREKFDSETAGNIVTGQADVFDVREKCTIEKKDSDNHRGAGLFRHFNPVERIRRLYKKRILSGIITADERKALNYMTAGECGAALSLPDMTRIYEKVRYSDQEITAEDVKRMKLACDSQTKVK